MIIKIIPETEAEKARISEVEHVDVRDFFIMGTKMSEEKDLLDFHDYSGSDRYFIGSLHYFLRKIELEHLSKNTNEISLQPKMATPPTSNLLEEAQGDKMIKRGEVDEPDLKLVKIDQPEELPPEIEVVPENVEEDPTVHDEEEEKTDKPSTAALDD